MHIPVTIMFIFYKITFANFVHKMVMFLITVKNNFKNIRIYVLGPTIINEMSFTLTLTLTEK